MAGPGGGPPRKSHTKSRKGCKTCKRRHIRCDEHFPQCRNCTKHNCRCDYMDSPPPSDEGSKLPKGPDLLWSHAIELEIDKWQQSGIFPFPELALSNHRRFLSLSRSDLRLIHHLSSIYRELQRKDMLQCTAWVDRLPLFLETAASHDFVMSAILAFSATHLAWITSSVETTNLAYHHRGIALNGLHMAIGNFSEKNSDPILAASILLSWQASDWGGWISLMQGISTVVSSMDPWKESSRYDIFVKNDVMVRSSILVQPQMTSTGAPILEEDDRSLQEAITALQQLYGHLQSDSSLSQRIEGILRSAREIQTSSQTMRLEQLFEKMQPLRSWLLWMPVSLLQANEIRSWSIICMAHLYSAALAVDASIPELGGASFGALTISPIEEIDRKIKYHLSTKQQGSSLQQLDDMMYFPRHIASRTHYQRAISVQKSEAVLPGQQSPYGFQNLQLDSAPSTPGFPGTYPLFSNPSVEDVSHPPSPFLQTYVSPNSRRHSQLVENSPRPGSINSFEQGSYSPFGQRADSPAYSTVYSTEYLEDEPGMRPKEQSSGYAGGGFPYDESSFKRKERRIN